MSRSRDKSFQLQPQIKLHRTDVQQICLPELPQIKEERDRPQIIEEQEFKVTQIKEEQDLKVIQIKEEQDLWTSQGGEQPPGLQSDKTDSIFSSPRVKTHCDPDDSSQLTPLDQTPSVENRERDSLPTNTTEGQIKAEPDEEDFGAPEPASDSQLPHVTQDCPTAQSLEELEERGGLLPELTAYCLRPLPTRVMKSAVKSRRTQAKHSRPIPSPCSSPGPSLRTQTSPSSWTKPISSSGSGSETEDVLSGEAENKTSDEPHQCEECGKSFSIKCNLVTHRRVHTGEKPYQCEECDKAFSKKCNLVTHRRVHTGQKPYQCEECDKAFRQNITLVRHTRIHTGEKPYQCEECDRAFSHNTSLVSHARIHTGEKPYHCEQCVRAFSQKTSLVRHARIHTA